MTITDLGIQFDGRCARCREPVNPGDRFRVMDDPPPGARHGVVHAAEIGTEFVCDRPAAERWAELDYDETDTPSVNDAFGEGVYRWPDPGEACLDVLATAQLYWPDLGP